MTTSKGRPSSIDSCGSTRMPPKQRNGAGSAATIRTSRQRVARLARGHVREDRPNRPEDVEQAEQDRRGRLRRREQRDPRPVRTSPRRRLFGRTCHICPNSLQSVSGAIVRRQRDSRSTPSRSNSRGVVADGRKRRQQMSVQAGTERGSGATLPRSDRGPAGIGRRRGAGAGRSGLRRRPIRLERDDRPPARGDRALPEHRRRDRGRRRSRASTACPRPSGAAATTSRAMPSRRPA